MGDENNNLTKLMAERRRDLPGRLAEYAAKHITEVSPNDFKEGMSLEILADFEDLEPNIDLAEAINDDSIGFNMFARVANTIMESAKKLGHPLLAIPNAVILLGVYVDYFIIIMDGEAIRKESAEKMQNIMRGTK